MLSRSLGGVQLVIAARDRLGLFSDTRRSACLAFGAGALRPSSTRWKEWPINTWRVDKQAVSDLAGHGVPRQAARAVLEGR